MELLDDYSMHNFVIWKGNAVRHAPEFISLARTYEPVWSSMDACVTILEEVMAMNDVPLAVIDGKKLSELAKFDQAQVDVAHLCSCIVNQEQIHSLPCPTTIKTSESKKKKAAETIQAIARRFLMSSKISFLTHRRNAAVKLQCLARGMRSRRMVSELLVRHRRDDESKWEGLQANLKANWEKWQTTERILIVVPSTEDDSAHNLLTSSAHWLMDLKVHVVCILPCPPDREELKYNHKILELTGNAEAPNRMTVMIPENVDLFQNHVTLASSLLYSPSCLKRIGRIIRGMPAVILSCQTGWQNKKLAVALGAPLLSTEPSIAASLQTHSGMKRVFAAADVCSPPGLHDVFDEEDVLLSLTELIACNLEVRRWHIKLDACRDNWGLAIMDTFKLPCMTELTKEKAQLERVYGSSSCIWHNPDVQLLVRARLLKTLRCCLHRTLRICCTDLCETWVHFLGYMVRVGGVIEAEAPENRSYPSASFFVSPSGHTYSLAEGEVLYDAYYTRVGCIYPQECVPRHALLGATAAISRELCSRGVQGYVSVQFTVFSDGATNSLRLWATGLELGLSRSTFSFFFFRLFTWNAQRFQGCECSEEPANVIDIDDRGERLKTHFFATFCKLLHYYQVLVDVNITGGSPLFRASQNELNISRTLTLCHPHPFCADGSLRYVYMDHVQHPNLKSLQIPVFFKLCRLEGISFDIATQVTTGVPTFTINLCDNSHTTLDVGSLVYSSTFIEGFIQDPSKK